MLINLLIHLSFRQFVPSWTPAGWLQNITLNPPRPHWTKLLTNVQHVDFISLAFLINYKM